MTHTSSPTIYTDRLRLHSLTDNDVNAVIDLLTDPEIIQTYMVPDFRSHDEARNMFERFKQLSESDERFVYGIYLEDELIGLINDVGISGKEIELGYVIHPRRKNRGFATEVLATAMRELFHAGYEVVRAGAFEENVASVRVMEKCRMVRTDQKEEIEYRGKIHHCVFYEGRKEMMKERFLFRAILPDEADRAVMIEQICFPPHEACSEKHMKERIAKAPELFLVAVDRENGEIAGFLNGLSTNEESFRDEFFTDAELYDPDGKYVMLLGLDVLPEYRRQGLGTALMTEYAHRERQNGRGALVLTCLQDKVAMYQKMGFRDDGIANSTWGGEEWHEMSIRIGE